MAVDALLDEALEALQVANAELDASCLNGETAEAIMDKYARAERLAAAGKSICAKRCVRANRHQRSGARSPADWVSQRSGDSPARAADGLVAAGHLDALGLLDEAFRSGELSPAQAREIAETAALDPSAEKDLLELAGRSSLKELRDEAERRRARARSEVDEAERQARLHRKRFLRTWTERDGAFGGRFSLTPLNGARLLAGLRPAADEFFARARRRGEHESIDAYYADALVAVVTGEIECDDDAAEALGEAPGQAPEPRACETPTPGEDTDYDDETDTALYDYDDETDTDDDDDTEKETSGDEPTPRRKPWVRHFGPAHVVLRADLAALLRGRLERDEICEIAGIGPVSLHEARALLGGDFVLDYVLTNGT
ncbi:MAG: hypothetical protein ACRD0B_02075, partial [Acidimicrobiales bacterium]